MAGGKRSDEPGFGIFYTASMLAEVNQGIDDPDEAPVALSLYLFGDFHFRGPAYIIGARLDSHA